MNTPWQWMSDSPPASVSVCSSHKHVLDTTSWLQPAQTWQLHVEENTNRNTVLTIWKKHCQLAFHACNNFHSNSISQACQLSWISRVSRFQCWFLCSHWLAWWTHGFCIIQPTVHSWMASSVWGLIITTLVTVTWYIGIEASSHVYRTRSYMYMCHHLLPWMKTA